MKVPYISSYSKALINNPNSPQLFYDCESQISYTDYTKKIKVIDKIFDKGFAPGTVETAVRETSDPDEFIALGPTFETRSREDCSDSDEAYLLGPTMLTESGEPQDEDELYIDFPINFSYSKENMISLGPTKQTFTSEPSDEDEYMLFANTMLSKDEIKCNQLFSLGPTTITKTTEDSDADELYC
ncbi:hypothetical protein [Ruminiclostridium cellobioparum]|uniref:hypothetical protein n=1 Tax=Ruminiclostridium cellobioparum TaxID=29355 RepID=UPI0028A6FD51|nr:hypothetical protein [Ruminiclostridium cellobioparum]